MLVTRRRPLALLAAAALVAGCGDDDPDRVGAFPAPGTESASPRTEISFRGAGADDLEGVEVVGSRSGERTGRVREHSDGEGASLVFAQPFRSGERVTVRTDLDIAGAREGDFRFATVARPKEGLGSGAPPRALLRQFTAQEGRVPAGGVPRYRTEPDVRPPEIEVFTKPSDRTERGHIFLAPKKVFGARERPGLQSGPMILDESGELVWFARVENGTVNDLRVQTYDDRPVLSRWQGRQVLGSGEGAVHLLDASYKRVKQVVGGNGYQLDFHEARITPEGTLLGLVYSPVDADLSSIGGPRDGRAIDSIVQEIDIATGRVLFEWHSIGNIAFEESHTEVPEDRSRIFDYVHANSVSVAPDGNLIVSARETWAVYKLDRRTGEILWRLGGKRDDFKLAKDDRFAWQHDAQFHDEDTIRIFDNAAAPKVRERSRVLLLDLDEDARTARRARQYEHPEDLLSGTQGNAQRLPNGNVFVGWGSQGYFSEFTPGGDLVFDARVARGNDTYRAYRLPWSARPSAPPKVVAEPDGDGIAVDVSWNGATDVAEWEVMAGDGPDALRPAGRGERDGFETRIEVDADASHVAVRARSADGEVLGTSEPAAVGG
jgi:Arylsulfotransferase (ASST)